VTLCDQPPNQPDNFSPTGIAAQCVDIPATLQSGLFFDPDGDIHAASQWQVRTNPGTYGPPYIVFDSERDIGNLTSIVLDKPTLDYETIYYWHVRHQDNTNAWSGWSAETSFRTCDTPPGDDVEVIIDSVPITFDEVSDAGCTIVTKLNYNPKPELGPLQSGLCPLLPFVFVDTTAVYQPPGTVTVGIPYDDSTITDENALKVFHETGAGWEDVTLYIDTVNNIAYGQDVELSWWCIGGTCPPRQSVPVFPSTYVGIAAALMAGILAYFLRRRLMRQE
jgi:hypothetical protein